jgi:hypothetical protein
LVLSKVVRVSSPQPKNHAETRGWLQFALAIVIALAGAVGSNMKASADRERDQALFVARVIAIERKLDGITINAGGIEDLRTRMALLEAGFGKAEAINTAVNTDHEQRIRALDRRFSEAWHSRSYGSDEMPSRGRR